MRRSFLCYIENHGDEWEAICPDLDICVAAASSEDARQSLQTAIHDYVHAAQAEAPSVRDQLLNRRAPLHVRFSLKAKSIFYSFASPPHGGRAQTFELPCPA